MEKTKSSKYWENRKEWLIYHQMESADRTADRIGKLYHRAYLEIEKKMNNVLDRFAFKYRMSREQALDILSRLNNRNDVDELIKELRLHGDNIDIKELSMMMDSPSYWYRINALKDTMAEVDTVMKLVYNNELAVSTEHYKKAANDSFLKNTYTLQQQTGYGYRVSTLPPETVSKLLKSKWSGANYSKRIWNNTTTLAGDLKTELLTSVLMGRTESETMKIFLNKFAVGANNARRLIRTESAYIYNQMDTEAYKNGGIEYYRFVATLDLKTSKVCQELDGKVFKTTDAQVGVNFPPMHPWCRSVTIANIDDDTLKTLDRRAGKEKVPADMTYKEWEDRFVVDDESKRDYIVKAYTPGQNIIKERMQVNKIIATMPKKVQDALQTTIISIGKNGASQYDYVNDILYVAKGADENAVIHEIGHMVENKLLDEQKVETLKKSFLQNVPFGNIKKDVYINADNEDVEVFLLLNTKFVSEYQGRLYVEDWSEIYDANWNVRSEVLQEFVSEIFREYIQNPERLQQEFQEFYNLIEEGIK